MSRTRLECLNYAAALEGALHLLDDDESAQTLARLADQWRAEAEESADPLAVIAELHAPMQNTYPQVPACPDCLGGIYADDPDEVRDCRCWGLSTPVCGSCADLFNGRRYPMQWPCPTARALTPPPATSPVAPGSEPLGNREDRP